MGIANAREQLTRDEERGSELLAIEDTRELTKSEKDELEQIVLRAYCIPWCENDGLPYFSIREYNVMK